MEGQVYGTREAGRSISCSQHTFCVFSYRLMQKMCASKILSLRCYVSVSGDASLTTGRRIVTSVLQFPLLLVIALRD